MQINDNYAVEFSHLSPGLIYEKMFFLNGSGIDENIPVFKIEVGLIEIIFPVNRSCMDEIKFSIQ